MKSHVDAASATSDRPIASQRRTPRPDGGSGAGGSAPGFAGGRFDRRRRLAGFARAVMDGSPPRSGAPRVEPRLQDRTSGRFVDPGAGLLAAHFAGGQSALGLHRRQAFVPHLYQSPGCIGDALRHGDGLARRRPFAAAHVERQADDEATDGPIVGQGGQRAQKGAAVASVEYAVRMRQEAEFVVDRHTHAHAAKVERARAVGALRDNHGQASSATNPARPHGDRATLDRERAERP